MTPNDQREFRHALRHRKGYGIFTGLLIATIGLALLADRMGYASFHHLWRQWPLLLLAMGLSKLWTRSPLSLGAHALIFVGAFFELRHLGYGVPWHPWWPLLIVWAGLVLTLRALRPESAPSEPSHD